MRILIIGSGGREHALGWKLSRSPGVSELLFAPGNGGTAELGRNLPVAALDVPGLVNVAREEKVDFTVVGPDDALALGVVDAFQSAGLPVFGPSRSAARFESSKLFSKDFMRRHGIPCAQSEEFSDPLEAYAYCRQAKYPLVVKADGLALGKGVVVAAHPQEAAFAIHRAMELRVFGEAGATILIEECLTGPECSIHAFVCNEGWLMCPDCRDHKRAYEGDLGPNTGGMGTLSPSGVLTPEARQFVEKEILDRFVAGIRADGIEFRGMLFPGLMLTPDGPKVLEFNCRFGDPETQVLMRRLESDLLEILLAVSQGRLPDKPPVWGEASAACVIMASGGYPGSYRKGAVIQGLDKAGELPKVSVFHAGTKAGVDGLVTSGGRVLGVSATGSSLPDAVKLAYDACERISFADAFYRRDIGRIP
jgi:phosphoribosylamine--glycine ligase